MARRSDRSVQQSVLDRLVDDEPRLAADAVPSWSESVALLKQAVRRDLEWLLNVRRTPQAPPAACEELRQSVYQYGIPDFTARSRETGEGARQVAREVEEAIALFEPRLAGARVVLSEEDTSGERRLHFMIEALLRMDPTPERVVFDTVLDVAKNEFEVQQPISGGG